MAFRVRSSFRSPSRWSHEWVYGLWAGLRAPRPATRFVNEAPTAPARAALRPLSRAVYQRANTRVRLVYISCLKFWNRTCFVVLFHWLLLYKCMFELYHLLSLRRWEIPIETGLRISPSDNTRWLTSFGLYGKQVITVFFFCFLVNEGRVGDT